MWALLPSSRGSEMWAFVLSAAYHGGINDGRMYLSGVYPGLKWGCYVLTSGSTYVPHGALGSERGRVPIRYLISVRI